MKSEPTSLADSLRRLPEAERRAIIESLTDEQAITFRYDWRAWGRPKQFAPAGDWWVWLVMAGRGFGKTRLAAEWVREMAARPVRFALVGRTASDVRDTMVEGENGILACSPPWDRPTYEPSKRRLTWKSGAIATTFTADEPDMLRGPQQHYAWCDELATWKYLQESWDNLMLGTRLGELSRVIVTTTPRPLGLLRRLAKDPHTILTTGSTYENVDNLSPVFKAQVVARYEGTTTGQQELEGRLLDESPGALWKRATLDAARVKVAPVDLSRVIVGVDPSGSSEDGADETGIVVVARGKDGKGYVLADRSLRATPARWAAAAVAVYHEFKADRIVAEANFGGEMVAHTIRTADSNIAVKMVHASRGKAVRAEPIAALYEQSRFHHVGDLALLEDQLVTWTPEAEKSPDRLDALVWAATELGIQARRVERATSPKVDTDLLRLRDSDF